MKKIAFTIVLCSFFFSASAKTNPLFGKWRQGSDEAYCKNDYIIFEANQARHVMDADGEKVDFHYKNVTFVMTPNLVTVDFHKQHAFGAAVSETKADFKILDSNHIQMIGKKNRTQDFFRCP